MISLEQCAGPAGFAAEKAVGRKSSADTPRSLYDSYLLHLGKGTSAVREMIISDIRMSSELGAAKQAADMAAVLRAFLSDHPEARPAHPPEPGESQIVEPSAPFGVAP